MPNYTQAATKCLACGLHYLIWEDAVGQPGRYRPTCPECHRRGRSVVLASRAVDGFVFRATDGGETAGPEEEPSYTQIACQCEDCLLDFLLCTWHPERHSQKSLCCPRCRQKKGRFRVARRRVAGFIFQTVPGPVVHESNA